MEAANNYPSDNYDHKINEIKSELITITTEKVMLMLSTGLSPAMGFATDMLSDFASAFYKQTMDGFSDPDNVFYTASNDNN